MEQSLFFKDRFSTASPNKMYLGVGKVSPWVADPEPDLPADSAYQEYRDYADMFALKRIQANDVSNVIRRIPWRYGIVFQQYENNVNNYFATNFYCVTDALNVYKCISNNDGQPSTVEPTGQSTTIFSTSDGYKWKFMYSVASSLFEFISDDWVPVKPHLTVNDGLNSKQWEVQLACVVGGIHHIKVNNKGANYTGVVNVTITGDGTGAAATATVTAGQISKIDITSPGTGYTFAYVQLSGGGSGAGAVAEAIISPVGGHGYDALRELGGHYVLANVRVAYDEGGKIPVTNDMRKLLVISDPLLYGTNTVATGSVYNNTWKVKVSSVSGYLRDDQIEGQTSKAKGFVVDIDVNNNTLQIASLEGSLQSGETIKNLRTNATIAIAQLTPPEIAPQTGQIIVKEYRRPIVRSSDQTEVLNVVFEF